MEPSARFRTTLATALLVVGGIVATLAPAALLKQTVAASLGPRDVGLLLVGGGGLIGGVVAARLFRTTALLALVGAGWLGVGWFLGLVTWHVGPGATSVAMGPALATGIAATAAGAWVGGRLAIAPWLLRSVASALLQVGTITVAIVVGAAVFPELGGGAAVLSAFAATFVGGALTVYLIPDADVATTTAGWVLMGVVAVCVSIVSAYWLGGVSVLVTMVGLIFTLPVPITAAAVAAAMVKPRPSGAALAVATAQS